MGTGYQQEQTEANQRTTMMTSRGRHEEAYLRRLVGTKRTRGRTTPPPKCPRLPMARPRPRATEDPR
eukprot:7261132-Pyramimonas_sp.AAC.1